MDVNTPLGKGTPILYVVPLVLTGFWTRPTEIWQLVVLTILCTIFSISGYFLSPPGHMDVAWENRMLAICVMWGTTIVALVRKGAEQDDEDQ